MNRRDSCDHFKCVFGFFERLEHFFSSGFSLGLILGLGQIFWPGSVLFGFMFLGKFGSERAFGFLFDLVFFALVSGKIAAGALSRRLFTLRLGNLLGERVGLLLGELGGFTGFCLQREFG